MPQEHFVRHLKHFAAHAKPAKERSVDLLLDNYDSHLAIRAKYYCKQNGETIRNFPP
jgi:hypothetical protein